MLWIEPQGVRIGLLGDKAAWLPQVGALVIADPHFGKAATFRAAGVPVPEAVTDRDLARLDRLLQETCASRLVVLGDLLHAKSGVTGALLARLSAWRETWAALPVVNIRGNHDRSAGDPPASLGIEVRTAGGFDLNKSGTPGSVVGFAHEPQDVAGAPLTLCGHLHPAVRLKTPGRRGGSMRIACFWQTAGRLIFPAFGGFTGAAIIRPKPGDGVYAVLPGDHNGPAEVIDAAALTGAARSPRRSAGTVQTSPE
ncbi:MAG: ligase-associated DNA damage response endonuclease PdeM [Planctomycetota bacterium]